MTTAAALQRSPSGDAISQFLTSRRGRMLVVQIPGAPERLARDVSEGLAIAGHRTLPCTYFYDQEGSCIYEEITRLPEYYPTRTEAAILARSAGELRMLLGPCTLIELGSGSSEKTRILLDAWDARRTLSTYVPIDVSRSALEEAARSLAANYPALRVLGLVGRYEAGLAALPAREDTLVMFLGGTLGNFDPAAQEMFFWRLAASMAPRSHLLLGFDRRPHAGKAAALIQRAYDDAAGVTARFNLNLLVRLNRELGAEFKVERFRHVALYNETQHQIEMHLESTCDQEIPISALGRTVRFSNGERILTEISRKFDPDQLSTWLDQHGFHEIRRYGDADQLFGVLLLQRR